MTAEMKDVLQTILQGRQYIFEIFHKLLGEAPTAEMVQALSSPDSMQALALFAQDDSAAPVFLAGVLARLPEISLDALEGEYTRLFLGPDDLIAPPWESVYHGTARALFQQSTLAVHEWYAKYGFVPKNYPHVPDDHVALMMHFLSLLCQRALDALESSNALVYRDALAAQLLFEQNHLMNWLGAYASDMKKSQSQYFYPHLVQAAEQMIAYDNGLLLEMMDGGEA